MALSDDQIKALLAQSDKPKRTRSKKSGPDTSTRDYKTWFALEHKFFDEDTGEPLGCQNPNCIDPRDNHRENGRRAQVLSEVNGEFICRYCFMEGYLLAPGDEQGTLNET